MTDALENVHLSFIGCGVMAESMIAGLLRQNLVAPENIVGSHPREAGDVDITTETVLLQVGKLKFLKVKGE